MMLRKGSLSREVLRDTATDARDWVLFGRDMAVGWIRYQKRNTFARLIGIKPPKHPKNPNTPRF